MDNINKLGEYCTFADVTELTLVINNFIANNHLTKSTLKILRLIEWHAQNYRGACWLKVKTIAEKVCVSDSTVRRSIKKLKELGILTVVPTTREFTGGDGANIYVINRIDKAVDSAEMTDRATVENADTTSVEPANSETEYVSYKKVTNKDIDYDHTYVRDQVPYQFTFTVKNFFDNATKIESLWKKVLISLHNHAPNFTGYEDESIELAIKAFK